MEDSEKTCDKMRKTLDYVKNPEKKHELVGGHSDQLWVQPDCLEQFDLIEVNNMEGLIG